MPNGAYWISELYIDGYRSFEEPTRIEFSKYVNVIYGPEDSGKSNIIAAIKWALGEEQNDVLFCGNSARRPAPHATVRLAIGRLTGAERRSIVLQRYLQREGKEVIKLNGVQITSNNLLKELERENFDLLRYLVGANETIEKLLSPRGLQRRLSLERLAGTFALRGRLKIFRKKLNGARRKHEREQTSDSAAKLRRAEKTYSNLLHTYSETINRTLLNLNVALSKAMDGMVTGYRLCLEIVGGGNELFSDLDIYVIKGDTKRPLRLMSGADKYFVLWAISLCLQGLKSIPIFGGYGLVDPPGQEAAKCLGDLVAFCSRQRQLILISERSWVTNLKGNQFKVQTTSPGVSEVKPGRLAREDAESPG